MKNILTICFICFLLSGCKHQADHNKINKLSWLEGKWAHDLGADGRGHEIWERKDDSTFTGKGFTIKDGDTVFMEYLSLEQHGSDVFYIPTIIGQNEGKPVPFKLTDTTNKTFVFENKEHDFPQRVVYSHPTADSIYAYIDGTVNGSYHKIEFPLERDRSLQ